MKGLRVSVGLVTAALSLILVNCKPIPYYLEQVCKVYGTVTVAGSEGATPIGSVEVFVDGYQYSELTNYNGDYELELVEGTWTVSFQKDGYEPASAEVTVSLDAPRFRLDVEMVKIGPPPPQDGSVTVAFSNAGAVEGKRVLVGVFPAGSDPSVVPIVAQGDFDIASGEGSQTLEVPGIAGEIWYGTGGQSYDLYLWVDMNDNLQYGAYYPEPGVDMELATFPVVVTIDGDVHLSYTGADLILVP